MLHNFRFKAITTLLASALLCSACQSFIPKAQGLVSLHWVAQNYQRQDQIEVQWKTHGFSFLLYQQQQGQKLEMVALSLTGQQLFKLYFDGQHVIVEQCVESMKHLPFDYVVRDILYATYPNFVQLQAGTAVLKQQEGLQTIYIQQTPVLNIRQQENMVELNNIQVPYQMVMSAVSNTLENDGELNEQ